MNILKGCHRRAIRLHVVLDLNHPALKGCPILETDLAVKDIPVPTLAPILIGLGHHPRFHPHQNGTLSSTHLGSLGRHYLGPQGLQVHLRLKGGKWLHLVRGGAEKPFLISTLVENVPLFLQHSRALSCTHHLVK